MSAGSFRTRRADTAGPSAPGRRTRKFVRLDRDRGFDLVVGLVAAELEVLELEGEEISLVSGSGSELNFNHADDILQSGWAQPSGALVPKSALALFHHHFTRRGVFLQD